MLPKTRVVETGISEEPQAARPLTTPSPKKPQAGQNDPADEGEREDSRSDNGLISRDGRTVNPGQKRSQSDHRPAAQPKGPARYFFLPHTFRRLARRLDIAI
jgi:hypothetical protein